MKAHRVRSLRIAFAFAASAMVASAVPVAAATQESGSYNCVNKVAYVHSYFNDFVSHYGPGGRWDTRSTMTNCGTSQSAMAHTAATGTPSAIRT